MYYNLISYFVTEEKSKFFGLIKTTGIVENDALQEIDSNGVVTRYLDLQGNEIKLPEVYESYVKTVDYKPTF